MISGTIDMKDMRYLNLFGRTTGISTRHVLKYNEGLVFCVPKSMISRALGQNVRNIRKISEILGKRIRVIPTPQGIEHAKQFIEAIVAPVNFKDLEVKTNEIVLTAGKQSKAALLGRGKRRLMEMQHIIKNFFGKEFRII